MKVRYRLTLDRFSFGIDNLVQFEKELNDDLAVMTHAVQQYGLPANLKLSFHSGSDKFSFYSIIRRAPESVRDCT